MKGEGVLVLGMMYTITEYTDWINIDVIDSVFHDPVRKCFNYFQKQTQ